MYEAQGQLEPALEYYQRAAEAKERGNDPSDLVTTLQALAEVQVELQQITEALQVYEKCLVWSFALRLPDRKGVQEIFVDAGDGRILSSKFEASN